MYKLHAFNRSEIFLLNDHGNLEMNFKIDESKQIFIFNFHVNGVTAWLEFDPNDPDHLKMAFRSFFMNHLGFI